MCFIYLYTQFLAEQPAHHGLNSWCGGSSAGPVQKLLDDITVVLTFGALFCFFLAKNGCKAPASCPSLHPQLGMGPTGKKAAPHNILRSLWYICFTTKCEQEERGPS